MRRDLNACSQFPVQRCSAIRIGHFQPMYKSMEHAGTKEIVPYKLYVPPLQAAYLEVLLYKKNINLPRYYGLCPRKFHGDALLM